MATLSEETKHTLRTAYTDEFMRETFNKVPTEPGIYFDSEGDKWLLTVDGHWYDNNLDTEDIEFNWILGSLGLTKETKHNG